MESPPIIGIDYLTDSRGVRKSVVIDLARHGTLLEEFFDVIISRERLAEGDLVSLEDFQKELTDDYNPRTTRQ
jgi:hypothetical protein